MASETGRVDYIEDAFAPGVREFFVAQGTLLGYTGNYGGNRLRAVWVHLHFSIVLDDGSGRYRNELIFDNTLDPSPYMGMHLNRECAVALQYCTPYPLCDSGGTSAGNS